MRVVVLGAAGQTGRLVVERLVAAGGDVLGVVRSPQQAADLHEAGASAAQADLVQVAPTELAAIFEGADAAIWAAGAGYGGDPELIDGDACIAAQQAADAAGASRWVQISSMYADRPDEGPPFMQPVLAAKNRSDTAVASTGLGWTVLRPGGLTDDVATGHVEIGTSLTSGTVPRADVAAVAAACLTSAAAACRAFDLVGGMTPIEAALAALTRQA